MKWCEHITWGQIGMTGEGWIFLKTLQTPRIYGEEFNFCPKCGAKKPKEDKKKIIKILNDLIIRHHQKYKSRDKWIYHFTADVEREIYKAVLDVVEDSQHICNPKNRNIRYF